MKFCKTHKVETENQNQLLEKVSAFILSDLEQQISVYSDFDYGSPGGKPDLKSINFDKLSSKPSPNAKQDKKIIIKPVQKRNNNIFGSANERRKNEISDTGSQISKLSKYSKNSNNRRRIVTVEPSE